MAKFKALLLSIGNNQKLGKRIGIFNLPQGDTCPGKTELCARICYACKASRCYKAAREMRIRNLLATTFVSFADDMIKEIQGTGVTMVRIHESGDFFNQIYLDQWVKIVKACPDVKFLSYTRSFKLDWSVATQQHNWSILWSIDSTSTLPLPLQNAPTAYLLQKGENLPTVQAFTCIHKEREKHYCGTTCKICWNAHTNGKVKGVYFEQH